MTESLALNKSAFLYLLYNECSFKSKWEETWNSYSLQRRWAFPRPKSGNWMWDSIPRPLFSQEWDQHTVVHIPHVHVPWWNQQEVIRNFSKTISSNDGFPSHQKIKGYFHETLPWNPSLVRQRFIQPAIDGQVLIRNKTVWLQWLTWDTKSWWWSYQLLPEPEVSVMYCLLWNRSARGPWNSGKWTRLVSTLNILCNVCRKCATPNALYLRF